MELIISLVSAVFSAAAVVVAYYSFRRGQESAVTPTLVFSRRHPTLWQIENVGSGPAVSLVIGDRSRDGTWKQVVNCYPIAAGTAVELPWARYGDQYGAVYTDVYGRAFTTICSNNRNEISKGNRFPDWNPKSNEWDLLQGTPTIPLGSGDQAKGGVEPG
jgi:hypothetical protein